MITPEPLWPDFNVSPSCVVEFLDVSSMGVTAEEFDQVDKAGAAVAMMRNTDGLATMYRVPPAVILTIIRSLK
jgi:hypothetical protein